MSELDEEEESAGEPLCFVDDENEDEEDDNDEADGDDEAPGSCTDSLNIYFVQVGATAWSTYLDLSFPYALVRTT